MIYYSSKCSSAVMWVFSTDESICRGLDIAQNEMNKRLTGGFLQYFVRQLKKNSALCYLEQAAARTCLISCSSLTGSALQVLLRIRYSTFINITCKSTVTKGLPQNTLNQWKDHQQLQQALHHDSWLYQAMYLFSIWCNHIYSNYSSNNCLTI